MSDIVERLTANTNKYPGFENLNTEAAAEIERLRARVAELEAELLRVRTTGHGAAHALDNIGVEHGLGPNASPLAVQEFVRQLAADRDRWKAIADKRHEILLELEWAVDDKDGDGSYCPYCMSMDDEVHVAGCKMAEAIAESARAANGGGE